MNKPFIGRLDPPFYDCYLGDGVYATFDGFQVWIDAGAVRMRDGVGNTGIALNRETIEKLVAYEKAAQDQYKPDSV